MTPIEFLSQPAWQRLGLALLHFLWQGVLVASLASAAVRLFKLEQGRTRYAVWLAALVVMAACPVATFQWVDVAAPQAEARETPPPLPAAGLPGGLAAERDAALAVPAVAAPDALPAAALADAELQGEAVAELMLAAGPEPDGGPGGLGQSELRRWLPWGLGAWLVGVTALSLRLLLGLCGLVRLRRRVEPLPAALADRVAALSRRLGLGRMVRVLASRQVWQPMVTGLVRPLVLLPASMLTRLSPEMLEAVIAHELAHVRRLDLWVNLLQRVVEILLFYHPAVWWVSRRLRLEREFCCDDLAVRATGLRHQYASALEMVGRMTLAGSAASLALGMSRRRGTLLDRVRHILGLAPSSGRSRWWVAGVVAIVLVAGLGVGIHLSGCGRVVGGDNLAGAAPEEGKGEESRAWHILRQPDYSGLLLGLPQQLTAARNDVPRDDALWTGVDDGGRLDLDLRVEGEAWSEITVGLFDAADWTRPPVQVRGFPGPGRYTVDRLPAGRYAVGAVAGWYPNPEAVGVDRSWPEPVEVRRGETTKTEVLVLADSRAAHAYGYGSQVLNWGLSPERRGDNLVTIQTVDVRGEPVPFIGLVLATKNPEGGIGRFVDAATGGDGVAQCWMGQDEFWLWYQRYSVDRRTLAGRAHNLEPATLYKAADQPTIKIEMGDCPTGPGRISGRVHDQHGKPLRDYFLTFFKAEEPGEPKPWKTVGKRIPLSFHVPIISEDGRYEVANLPLGTYNIHARAFDCETHVDQEDKEITLSAERPELEVDIELEARVPLYGRALFKDGTPVGRGVWAAQVVDLQRGSRQGGRFSQSIKPDGSLRVCLSEAERQDLLKNQQGMIQVSSYAGGRIEEIGEVHVDKLSKEPDKPYVATFDVEPPRSLVFCGLDMTYVGRYRERHELQRVCERPSREAPRPPLRKEVVRYRATGVEADGRTVEAEVLYTPLYNCFYVGCDIEDEGKRVYYGTFKGHPGKRLAAAKLEEVKEPAAEAAEAAGAKAADGSEKAGEFSCSGTVLDADGRPLAGGAVTVYQMALWSPTFDLVPVRTLTTTDGGTFSFSTDDERGEYQVAVEKPGHGIGWNSWLPRNRIPTIDIRMNRPADFGGRVTDAAGKPIAGAAIRLELRVDTGLMPQWLQYLDAMAGEPIRTGADGRFLVRGVPAGAMVSFYVEAPGYARRWVGRTEKLQAMKAGQTDVEVVLQPESRIEGTVVDAETGRPVPGLKLGARPDGWGGAGACESDGQGRFSFASLQAAEYKLYLARPRRGIPDWILPAPVSLKTEDGKTVSGVRLAITRGGVLEVKVVDANNPDHAIEQAGVSVSPVGSADDSTAYTDEAGMARFRLAAGRHSLKRVRQEDYAELSPTEDVEVTLGGTSRTTVKLEGPKWIRGVVRDAQGRPVEGAMVSAKPGWDNEARSDAEGRFATSLNTRPWMLGTNDRSVDVFVLARVADRNLAALIQVEDVAKPVEIVLAPAKTLTGRVVDADGKPIAGAQVFMGMRGNMYSGGRVQGTWGSTLIEGDITADAEGRYEIAAIPPSDAEYHLSARAEGFGMIGIPVDVGGAADRGEAEPIVLPRADLAVSGTVLDADGKALTKARISVRGTSDWKNLDTRSDAEGKFTVEGLCPGEVRLQAFHPEDQAKRGSATVEAGTTDVKLVIGQTEESGRRQPPLAPEVSLLGKPLPALEGVHIHFERFDAALAKGKPILVCLWDFQQRPSRHAVEQLAGKAEALKARGVTVVALLVSQVDEARLKAWLETSGVAFPVGSVGGDADAAKKSLAAWGAKGLPWFILTDGEHVVRAEGFPVDELDAKLKELPAGGAGGADAAEGAGGDSSPAAPRGTDAREAEARAAMERVLADAEVPKYGLTWRGGGKDKNDRGPFTGGALFRVRRPSLSADAKGMPQGLIREGSLYGRLEFADEARTALDCGLLRSADGGDYDRFFIDLDRDGKLGEGEVFQGRALESTINPAWVEFHYGPLDIELGAAGSRRTHRVFPWLMETADQRQFYVVSHCYTAGKVRLGDDEVEVVLVDYNCDGRYDSCGPEETGRDDVGVDRDRIGIDRNGDGRIDYRERDYVGRPLVWKGRGYRTAVSADGLRIAVVPDERPTGRIELDAKEAYLELHDEQGPLSLHVSGGASVVPAGTYELHYAYVVGPGGSKGRAISGKTMGAAVTTGIEVKAGQATRLALAALPEPAAPPAASDPMRAAKEIRALVAACYIWASSSDGQEWPANLKELVDKHLVKLGEGANLELDYGYVRPPANWSKLFTEPPMVIYEFRQEWGKGIWVGFADGHAERIAEKARFSELLDRSMLRAKFSDLVMPEEPPPAGASLAWEILRRPNAPQVLHGLPQRLQIAALSGKSSDPAWAGMVEGGGSVDLTLTTDGEPLGNILVGFFAEADWSAPPVQVRRISRLGRHVLSGLPPGKYVIGAMVDARIFPVVLGLEEHWPKHVEVKAGETTRAAVLMSRRYSEWEYQPRRVDHFLGRWEKTDPERAVQGTVTAPDGSPAAFAEVQIRSAEKAGEGTAPRRTYGDVGTDASGRYYFKPVEGPYRVGVVWRRPLPGRMASMWVYVADHRSHEGPQTVDFKIPLTPSGSSTVSGRVVDQDGRPIKTYKLMARLEVTNERGRDFHEIGYRLGIISEEGRFRLTGLPAGKWRLNVVPYCGYSRSYDWESLYRWAEVADGGTCDVEFALKRIKRTVYHGRLVFDDGTAAFPIPPAWPGGRPGMHLLMPGGGFGMVGSDGDVKEDGTFTIELSDEELAAAKAKGGKLSVYMPLPGELQTSTPAGEFPLESLVTDREKARTVVVMRVGPRGGPAPRTGSLVGKPLPGFDGIRIDFNPAGAKGKAILVCFWDVEVRGARRTLEQLAARAAKLAEQGVVVLAVHGGTAGEQAVSRWVKERGVSVPVGIIDGDEQQAAKLLAAWGVKGLPWLILADGEHNVRAEGFALGELDAKLKEMGR